MERSDEVAPRVAAIGATPLGHVMVRMAERLALVESEAERLRVENAKMIAALVHYEGWFGTECPCDDNECALDGWAK